MSHKSLWILFIAVTILFLFTNSCARKSEEGVPKGIIKGQVFKETAIVSPLLSPLGASATLVPVPNARVEAERTNLVVMTDEDGNFEIKDVPEGSHDLLIEKDEDGDGNTELKLEKKGLQLNKDTGVDLKDLLIEDTGGISGLVTLEGKATGNAGIVIVIPGSSYIAVTSDDGSYSIPYVARGTYIVGASYYGYSVEKMEDVVVTPGAVTKGINMTLVKKSATGSLQGKALLAGKTDHAGITIALNPQGAGGAQASASTDSSGSYSLTGVSTGIYKLIASKDGYIPVTVVHVLVYEGEAYTIGDIYLLPSSASQTVNIAPVADAGGDQSVDVGSAVQLDGSKSSDANNDPLTYTWAIVSRPASSAAALSDSRIVNPSFIADAAGAYNINLIVNDGKVDSLPDSAIITAVAYPNISGITPTGGIAGQAISISGSNFGTAQGTVNIGGVITPSSFWSDVLIDTSAPDIKAGIKDVVITTAEGRSCTPGTFALYPYISSRSPSSGPPCPGSSVVCATGTSFGDTPTGATVTINGLAGSPYTWTNNLFCAGIPCSATSGDIVVTIDGLSSNGVYFTVTP